MRQRNQTEKNATLSIPCDIYSLSDRQCYVWSHFTELSTATESDGA